MSENKANDKDCLVQGGGGSLRRGQHTNVSPDDKMAAVTPAPTPRTDAEVIKATFPDADVVSAAFACQLERELATANANRLLAEHERNEARTALSATLPSEPTGGMLRAMLAAWFGRTYNHNIEQEVPDLVERMKAVYAAILKQTQYVGEKK